MIVFCATGMKLISVNSVLDMIRLVLFSNLVQNGRRMIRVGILESGTEITTGLSIGASMEWS